MTCYLSKEMQSIHPDGWDLSEARWRVPGLATIPHGNTSITTLRKSQSQEQPGVYLRGDNGFWSQMVSCTFHSSKVKFTFKGLTKLPTVAMTTMTISHGFSLPSGVWGVQPPLGYLRQDYKLWNSEIHPLQSCLVQVWVHLLLNSSLCLLATFCLHSLLVSAGWVPSRQEAQWKHDDYLLVWPKSFFGLSHILQKNLNEILANPIQK